jgi:hypothetical protein
LRSLPWCRCNSVLVPTGSASSFGVSCNPFYFGATEVGKQELPRPRHMAGSAPGAKGAHVHRVSGTARSHASNRIRSRHRAGRNPRASCNARSSNLQPTKKAWGGMNAACLALGRTAGQGRAQVGCVSFPSPQLRPDFHCPAIQPFPLSIWLQRPPTLSASLNRAYIKHSGSL